jgi:hypothetical protein
VKIKLFLIVLLFSVMGHSKGFREPRAKWLTSFRKELKEEFCYSKSYFKQCTTVKQKQCSGAVSTALSNCIKSSKLPKSIDPMIEGIGMGYSLGRCVGLKLSKKYKLKNRASEKCRDVASW